jgi:glycosyltransferase involved in cell wall biosynthesis
MNTGVIVDNDLVNDKRVLREIKIIREDGHRVFVLCFGFKGKTYPEIPGLTITRITISKNLKNTLFFFLNTLPVYEWVWACRIRKFINANNIDALHAHDLYMSKAAHLGIIRSGKKIPLILDMHENFSWQVTSYNWTKGLFRNLFSRPGQWVKKEKQDLLYADRIIVLSEEFRDHLVSKYPELKKDNFCALPNVPDVVQMETFKTENVKISFTKKSPILFYFGVVAERRGIFDALSVFSSVVREGFNLDFLIIGPVDKKDQDRFYSIINSEELKDHVIYYPWIDLSELPAYLGISDICIAPFLKNPHHESGVANKIYDYMLGSKPLIVSDCLPQKRVIEKHNCGIAYGNLNEFHDAVIKLYNDPGLRSKMGENGYNAILNEYNMENLSGNLKLLYNSIRN